MKRLVYLFLFFPVLAFSQYDFDTRYFVMDDASLTAPPSYLDYSALFNETPAFQKKTLHDFVKVTVANYYQPVAMTDAVSQNGELQQYTPINLPSLQQKEFGFSFSVGGRNSFDGTSKNGIRNTVYREMRPAYFCQRTGLNLITGN